MRRKFVLTLCSLLTISCRSTGSKISGEEATTTQAYTFDGKNIDVSRAQELLSKSDNHCAPPAIEPSQAKVEIPVQDIFIPASDRDAVIEGLLDPAYWRDAKDATTQKPLFSQATDGSRQEMTWPDDNAVSAKMREFDVRLVLGGLLGYVDMPLQLYVSDNEDQIRLKGYNYKSVQKVLSTVIGVGQFSANLTLDPLKQGGVLQGYLMSGRISAQLQGAGKVVPGPVIEKYARSLWSVFVLAVSRISGRECGSSQQASDESSNSSR